MVISHNGSAITKERKLEEIEKANLQYIDNEVDIERDMAYLDYAASWSDSSLLEIKKDINIFSIKVWSVYENEFTYVCVGRAMKKTLIAISHVWKDSLLFCENDINCADETCFKNNNYLKDAFLEIAIQNDLFTECYIWMDILSIDQRNDFEIRDATYSMSYIYFFAFRVVILSRSDVNVTLGKWLNSVWTVQETVYANEIYVFSSVKNLLFCPRQLFENEEFMILRQGFINPAIAIKILEKREGGWSQDKLYALRHVIPGLKDMPCLYDRTREEIVQNIIRREPKMSLLLRNSNLSIYSRKECWMKEKTNISGLSYEVDYKNFCTVDVSRGALIDRHTFFCSFKSDESVTRVLQKLRESYLEYVGVYGSIHLDHSIRRLMLNCIYNYNPVMTTGSCMIERFKIILSNNILKDLDENILKSRQKSARIMSHCTDEFFQPFSEYMIETQLGVMNDEYLQLVKEIGLFAQILQSKEMNNIFIESVCVMHMNKSGCLEFTYNSERFEYNLKSYTVITDARTFVDTINEHMVRFWDKKICRDKIIQATYCCGDTFNLYPRNLKVNHTYISFSTRGTIKHNESILCDKFIMPAQNQNDVFFLYEPNIEIDYNDFILYKLNQSDEVTQHDEVVANSTIKGHAFGGPSKLKNRLDKNSIDVNIRSLTFEKMIGRSNLNYEVMKKCHVVPKSKNGLVGVYEDKQREDVDPLPKHYKIYKGQKHIKNYRRMIHIFVTATNYKRGYVINEKMNESYVTSLLEEDDYRTKKMCTEMVRIHNFSLRNLPIPDKRTMLLQIYAIISFLKRRRFFHKILTQIYEERVSRLFNTLRNVECTKRREEIMMTKNNEFYKLRKRRRIFRRVLIKPIVKKDTKNKDGKDRLVLINKRESIMIRVVVYGSKIFWYLIMKMKVN